MSLGTTTWSSKILFEYVLNWLGLYFAIWQTKLMIRPTWREIGVVYLEIDGFVLPWDTPFGLIWILLFYRISWVTISLFWILCLTHAQTVEHSPCWKFNSVSCALTEKNNLPPSCHGMRVSNIHSCVVNNRSWADLTVSRLVTVHRLQDRWITYV